MEKLDEGYDSLEEYRLKTERGRQWRKTETKREGAVE